MRFWQKDGGCSWYYSRAGGCERGDADKSFKVRSVRIGQWASPCSSQTSSVCPLLWKIRRTATTCHLICHPKRQLKEFQVVHGTIPNLETRFRGRDEAVKVWRLPSIPQIGYRCGESGLKDSSDWLGWPVKREAHVSVCRWHSSPGGLQSRRIMDPRARIFVAEFPLQDDLGEVELTSSLWGAG